MSKHPILILVVALPLLIASLPACNKIAPGGTSNDSIQITSYAPTTIHGGDTLTVYGKNLPTDPSAYSVTLNGKVFNVIASNADSIEAIVPKMAGSGYAMVKTDSATYKGPFLTYDYVVTVSTIAGTGSAEAVNGPALSAAFNCPWGITADANGDLYIADTYNRLLRVYTAASGIVSEIDIAPVLNFADPYNIALDRATHDIYVTDFNQHIGKVPSGGAFNVFYTDSMVTTGIAFGPDGYLYVSNNDSGTVTRMDTYGNNRMIIGRGITTPRNLIFDKNGNLYVAAYGIYEITPADVQTEITFDNKFEGWEIARDSIGNIYEADHFNNNLRMIEASTGNAITIAGSGEALDADGIGLAASFNGPQGLCIDDNGNLYMTTYNYNTGGGNKIRKIMIR